MILVITDSFDAHADVVIKKLERFDYSYFRLNVDVDSLKETKITYESGEWTIRQNQKSLRSSLVSSVWCRRSSIQMTAKEKKDMSNGFILWKSEWNRALFGFYNSLSKVFWMNNIRNATLAENKFYQHKVAEGCDLSLPEFITSNNKVDLELFSQSFDSIALKFMGQELYESDDGTFLGLYVNKITHTDLLTFDDRCENPITIQRYIEKDFEVRYTVVGNEHFVCRISSQESQIANIDWRRYDVKNTPHYRMDPPDTIRHKVNQLCTRLGLSFGALDFVVDKSGKWWFLEVNSGGQWLWIEDLSGLQISDSITMNLVQNRIS